MGSPEGSPADSSVTGTFKFHLRSSFQAKRSIHYSLLCSCLVGAGGSKTVPSTATSSASGLKMDMTIQLIVFATFMASCVSAFGSF